MSLVREADEPHYPCHYRHAATALLQGLGTQNDVHCKKRMWKNCVMVIASAPNANLGCPDSPGKWTT